MEDPLVFGNEQQHNIDNIPRVIGELITEREGEGRGTLGGSWHVAFAADESRFAWSTGGPNVTILPWNRYKNCLQSDNNLDENGEMMNSNEKVEVKCSSFIVTSVAFGTSTPENLFVPAYARCYWQKLDNEKHLVLATGHDKGRIRIINPYTGYVELELTDHRKPVRSLAFATDGSMRLASGSDDGNVKIWDMQDDGNMFKTFKEHRYPVLCVAWSADSKLLCSVGTQQKAFLWDMVNYTMRCRLIGHYNDVLSCSFSPDGATVATSSADTRVIIWDTINGECIRELNHVWPRPGVIYMSGSNNSRVNSVSFSPDGCSIASVCSDGYLRCWDMIEGNIIEEQPGEVLEGDTMVSCTFSPMGGSLAVGYASGNVMFYSTPKTVPTLRHLSRMALRKMNANPFGIGLPQVLEAYIRYKYWS